MAAQREEHLVVGDPERKWASYRKETEALAQPACLCLPVIDKKTVYLHMLFELCFPTLRCPDEAKTPVGCLHCRVLHKALWSHAAPQGP